MTVPTGTAGATAAVGSVTGIGAGTVALAGTVLTYTVATPAVVAAGTAVSITVTTLTNTSTLGTYTATLATASGSTAVDTGTTGAVTVIPALATFSTSVFTNACGSPAAGCSAGAGGSTSITLLAVPGTAVTATVSLSVDSDAAHGYRVRAQSSGFVRTGGGTALPEASTAGSATLPVGQFYATASLVGSGTSGAALCSPYGSANRYVGYGTTPASIWNATASTGGGTDTVTVTDGIEVTSVQAAGTYTSTIAYTVNPASTTSSTC